MTDKATTIDDPVVASLLREAARDAALEFARWVGECRADARRAEELMRAPADDCEDASGR